MNRKTLSQTFLGSAIAVSATLAPIAQANENPFAMKMVSIYRVAETGEAGEKMKDGKCGEGKCSGKMKAPKPAKAKEGNCGANKMKEGGCSGAMKMLESGGDAEKTEEPASPKP
jgi:uncharacterized low-complexity protein